MRLKFMTLCILIIVLFMLALSVAKSDECLDPTGYTWLEKPDEDTILIGRIATGIVKIKHDYFYVCGELLSKEEAQIYATNIAYFAVKNKDKVNPWGLIGTIMNESGFDYCALGMFPREYAIYNGMIKRNKKSISYKRSEILKIVNNKEVIKRFKNTGIDIGLCQILKKPYLSEYGTSEEILSLYGSLDACIGELGFRGLQYKTNKPWMYWPGYKAEWYGKKIRNWARSMGARKGEI